MDWLTGYLAFGISTCFVLLYFFGRRLWGKSGMPKGPKGLPFLGWVRFVLSETPTKLLHKEKLKFGNVFGFYVGNQYCVVLSDYPSVKEGFCKRTCQDRPPGYLRTSKDCKNYSEMERREWEIHRLFLSNSLRFLGVGRSRFEDIVQGEVSRMISKLEVQVGKAECNIRDVISGSIYNAVFQLVCSRWFEQTHPVMVDFSHFLTLAAESFSNNMAFIYFPCLDGLLSRFHPHYRRIHNACGLMIDFLQSEIRARENVHDENSKHDYIDLYLSELKTGKHSLDFFDKSHLVTNCLLVMMAGSDTTRNTLEWLTMAMANFPEIQERVFQEITSVVGHERNPSWEDKPKLPYTEAAILESERWQTLVPLNCLRWTSEDTVIQGFTVPKDTVLINNLYSCHMDPKFWDSPKDFVPERFLSEDRSKVVIPESFLPFSLGKRNCPGEKMAAVELFLHFSAIIQKFKILPPPGGVDFTSCHRINRQAERPVVRVQQR